MYILITPAKNEEEYLPKVIKQFLKQKSKPLLWVIVDDNSSDNTYDIGKSFSEKISWIELYKIKRDNNEYDSDIGYSQVVKLGIDYAKKMSDEKSIHYEYIGILDSDIILDRNYFGYLVNMATETSKCGIISGLLHQETKKDSEFGSPRGGARLYNKKCLESIGGYPITAAPDTVTNIKAKKRGWKLLKIKEVSGLQLRAPWIGNGIWQGYKKKGQGRYYLNYYPVNAFLTGVYLCSRYPFYIGIAFLYGYFSFYFLSKKQTEDEEVREYFGEKSFTNLKTFWEKTIFKMER